MKKLIYQVLGYQEVFNPESGEIEKQESLATISTDDVSAEAIERAKADSYNGEYTIEDDGEVEVPTAEERIAALESALLELLGVFF